VTEVAPIADPALRPPADEHGAVFNAPWEAQAFALALALHQRGVFTWPEWAAELARAIRDAQAQGDPDTGATYYRHWTTALERIAAAKGLVTQTRLAQRRAEWADAARRTPHGKPIVLG
jgi:nitrile hydratase accessory protein